MGVPVLFAWLLKTIDELKKLGVIGQDKLNIITPNLQIPINKFYIDGNCLVHPICFYTLAKYSNHANVTNLNWLQNKMYKNVLKYIKHLIDYVNPKSVYLAIDGVAPLAKISQQRKRRFMSVLDSDIVNEIKKKHGVDTPEIWNNTCISPGTEFMENMHKYLSQELPKLNVQITYSSYHDPGEGEHKILQDIKLCKNPNTDVIYGLDADLIFLSLASNKRNIYLLREESQISNKKSKHNDMFEPLIFVSISDLAKAINFKIFYDVNKMDKIEFDINEVPDLNYILNNNDSTFGDSYFADLNGLKHDFVNDFIFLCYLLGNDFLPHIPSIDIKLNGLKLILGSYVDLYNKYKTNLLTVDTEGNTFVNNVFFTELIKLLSFYEKTHFTIFLPRYLEKLEMRKCQSNDPLTIDIWNFNNVVDRDANILGYGEVSEWKYNYYSKYFGTDSNQQEIINKASKNFLEGMMWTTKYYFQKCPSWDYQYNYNYCPFISDIYSYIRSTKINMNATNFNTDLQRPIGTYTQLIAMLPPQRSMILPTSFKKLVTQESLIIDMYPTTVIIDTMNKEQRFKCVPNLPIIDLSRIQDAIKKLELTKDEKLRAETFGPSTFN